ncbi:MAG TPA: hypothetical protein VGC80_16385, partial [Acetobacteraceae bacterium]
CGAQAWSIYYNINDPEHCFQQTAPTILLFLLLFSSRTVRLVLPAWALVTAAVNLAVMAVPQASYPLGRYEAALRQMFSPRDLLVSFDAYGGGASMGFFSLPGVPQLKLDDVLTRSSSMDAGLAEMDRRIGEAHARGGQVVFFGVLDPYEWNGAWSLLPMIGMPKARLLAYANGHYRVVPLGPLAGINAWRIEARTP